MKRFTLSLALLLALAMCASPAYAQTVVVNPTTVEFTPSVDHNAVSIDGQPMIARYELRIYIEATSALLATIDLGKPTPLANLITVTNPAWFSPLQPNTRLVGRFVAVGPTGEGVGALTNPFGVAGPPTAPTAGTVRK
jgi:hypothetical protein